MHVYARWRDAACCAEAVGGAIAGLLAAPLYGVGAAWLKGMLPWHKSTESPTGPHGKLVDHAKSLSRQDAEMYKDGPSDVGSSPNSPMSSTAAEQQRLHTLV